MSDLESDNNEKYPYDLISFPNYKDAEGRVLVDVVLSSWTSYNKKKNRHETKFPPPPYSKSTTAELNKLLKTFGKAPDYWSKYTIEYKGQAQTLKEAKSLLMKLQFKENVFTTDSECTGAEKAEIVKKKRETKKLKVSTAEEFEIFNVSKPNDDISKDYNTSESSESILSSKNQSLISENDAEKRFEILNPGTSKNQVKSTIINSPTKEMENVQNYDRTEPSGSELNSNLSSPNSENEAKNRLKILKQKTSKNQMRLTNSNDLNLSTKKVKKVEDYDSKNSSSASSHSSNISSPNSENEAKKRLRILKQKASQNRVRLTNSEDLNLSTEKVKKVEDYDSKNSSSASSHSSNISSPNSENEAKKRLRILKQKASQNREKSIGSNRISPIETMENEKKKKRKATEDFSTTMSKKLKAVLPTTSKERKSDKAKSTQQQLNSSKIKDKKFNISPKSLTEKTDGDKRKSTDNPSKSTPKKLKVILPKTSKEKNNSKSTEQHPVTQTTVTDVAKIFERGITKEELENPGLLFYRIIDALQMIHLDQKEIKRKLNELEVMLISNGANKDLPISFAEKYQLSLPLSSVECLIDFENKLKSDLGFRHEFKQTFNTLIDRNRILPRTLVIILKTYLSRDIVLLFNALKKTENKPLIFKDTEIYKCMLDSITKNFKMDNKDLNERDFLRALGPVLTNAVDWDGYRALRTKKLDIQHMPIVIPGAVIPSTENEDNNK